MMGLGEEGGIPMLPRKWSNLERQRPRLRWAKWGMVAGAVLTVLGILGVGSWPVGVVVLGGSGVWAFSILNK